MPLNYNLTNNSGGLRLRPLRDVVTTYECDDAAIMKRRVLDADINCMRILVLLVR
jgi:hypothetical protein